MSAESRNSSMTEVEETNAKQQTPPPSSEGQTTEKDGAEGPESPAATEPAKPQSPPAMDRTVTAWVQVAASFVAWFLSLGLVNAFGQWQDFYTQSDYLAPANASDISWIGSLQAFLMFFGSLVTGPLFDRGYYRGLLVGGSFLIVFGMMMTSLCTQYWEAVLAQGIVVGMGVNCIFMCGIAILPTYFTEFRALALGIAVSGSSIGGIVYSIAFRELQIALGFAWATRIIAFVALGLSAIPVFGLRMRTKPAAVRKLFDISAWKSPAYCTLSFATFLGAIAFYIPYFYVQIYATDTHIAQGSLQTYLVALINAGSLFGRIILGALADKAGPLHTIMACYVFAGLMSFVWIAVTSTAGIVIFSLVYGFFTGGIVSLCPACCARLCPDMRSFAVFLGMQNLSLAFGLLIGSPISGALISSGFISIQSFCGAMLFAAVLFCIVSRLCQNRTALFAKV